MLKRWHRTIIKILASEDFKSNLTDTLSQLFPGRDSKIILKMLQHYYSPKNVSAGPNTLFLPHKYTLIIGLDGIYFTCENQTNSVDYINRQIQKSIPYYQLYFRKRRKYNGRTKDKILGNHRGRRLR